jgi:hypothetical protein
MQPLIPVHPGLLTDWVVRSDFIAAYQDFAISDVVYPDSCPDC